MSQKRLDSNVICVILSPLIKIISRNTWELTPERNPTYVIFAHLHLQGKCLGYCTPELTQAKNHTNAKTVPPPLLIQALLNGINWFTLRKNDLSVISVHPLSLTKVTGEIISELIQGKNHTNVSTVPPPLPTAELLIGINWFTLRRNDLNVVSVLPLSLSTLTWKITSELIQEKNHINVINVHPLLHRTVRWRSTKDTTPKRSHTSVVIVQLHILKAVTWKLT